MKLVKTFLMVMMAFFVSACDSRLKLFSDNLSFSVGGIQLGVSKESLKSPVELIGCTAETTDKAKCYVGDANVRYDFFGANAHFIEVKLHAPYKSIEEIYIAIKGRAITKGEIEEKWNLKGRCLDRHEIDASQKFDTETSGYFLRALDEFNLLPSGGGDFICLSDKNEFFKYSQYTGKTEGSIDIYYLKDVFATNYRYVFQSKRALEKSNEEVAKVFAKPVIQIPKNECGEKYAPNSQAHGQSMEKLAIDAGYENGVDRYFLAFVSELCTGAAEDAMQYVSNAQIPIKSAQFVARYFGIQIEFEEPSAQSRLIEKTRQDLANLGACQACAGNAAMYGVMRPNSECGSLVKSALNGDMDAVRKIDKFPAICEWKF
ncbi:hypothetical protein [Hydrogenophaga pseudoflava]|uniref:Lipoprotein n=1 Tax=Hydrogenophaga pseudoflava TaxID=47421 RepID=A0A4P6WUE2_HYDPS|nr:hypothetical protein [Hydrogenophaga pseudoflava]QBM26096.1 hypothetical protein HPF_00305 [Hydrogenophaga pseudoflava]